MMGRCLTSVPFQPLIAASDRLTGLKWVVSGRLLMHVGIMAGGAVTSPSGLARWLLWRQQ